MKSIAFIFCLAAASFCTPAQAQALRCNNDLATVRDSKAAVLYKCGEPFFTDSYCKTVDPTTVPYLPYLPLPCQLVEDWFYNPGSGQFIAILRFEAGVLTSIRYGDRVK